jgi:LemA protein
VTSTLLLLGITLASLIYGITLYLRLANLKRAINKAWVSIDAALEQRHDELPALVELCKQYKTFEQKTLQRVTEARSRVQDAREAQDIVALGKAENMLRAGLRRLFVVAENYPELRNNEHFMQLQTRISGLEDSIADRCERYNESVNRHNVGIEQFPAVLIANMFAYQGKPLLVFSAVGHTA